MGLSKIDDVDVIADTGAVRGWVVVAEDGESFALTEGDLQDDRDEVRFR